MNYAEVLVVRSFAVIVSACFLAAAEMPPPPAVPRVLLDAPVNLTWAANHAEYWTAKGINGFLVHGIFDTCSGSIWSQDGEPDTTGAGDALLAEVRLAHQRIASSGIADNFLRTGMPPASRAFEDPAEADALIAALGDAADFALLAGFRGLALDTASSELPYYFTWDGYATRDGSTLGSGAIALGRRMAQIVAARAAGSPLLVIYDGPMASGPLWPSFFQGLAAGARSSRFDRVQLLTRATFDLVDPALFLDACFLEKEYLRLHLQPEMFHFVAGSGLLVPGLRPLRQLQAGGEVYAAYPVDAFRVQLATAKLHARDYVWIDAAGQTWWEVEPSDAPVYATLHQLGDAIGGQTKRLPDHVKAITAVTPFDEAARVEALDAPLPDRTALMQPSGAAVVLWPAQTLRIEADEHATAVTNIAEGVVRALDDVETIASNASPLFIQGLSVARRVVPSCLWLDYSRDALERWSDPLSIRFGFANRTSFSMEGAIDMVPPRDWHINITHQPLVLEPGQRLEVQSALHGGWRAGEEVALRGTLAIPGAQVHTRTWAMNTPPQSLWRAIFPGAMVLDPVWCDADADGEPEVLATSTTGDLVCMTREGARRWGLHAGRGYGLPAVAGRAPAGWAAVAVIDREHTLRIIRGDGHPVAERTLPEMPATAPLVADIHPFAGDEFVVLMPSGLLQLWRLDGVLMWERATNHTGAFVTASLGKGDAASEIIVAGFDASFLDSDGEVVDTVPLDAMASCSPVIGDSNADAVPDVLIGLSTGTVVRIQDHASEILSIADGSGPITQVTPLADEAMLVRDAAGLHCYGRDWQRQWFWQARNLSGCLVLSRVEPPIILVSQASPAQVVCLSATGVVQWEDVGPLWGPVSVPAATVDGTHVRFVYGSADGALRVRGFNTN